MRGGYRLSPGVGHAPRRVTQSIGQGTAVGPDRRAGGTDAIRLIT